VRGCHAKADISDEEVIIEVPLKCLITVEMGKDTHVGRAILSSRIELDAPKHIFLMIFMLLDRKKVTYYCLLMPFSYYITVF
jgi:histone-lysine N-methyltransferase SETD3